MPQAQTLLQPWVVRQDAREVEIHWSRKACPEPVAVFAGDRPEQITRAVDWKPGMDGVIRISGLEPDIRYYFKIAGADGTCRVCAERRLRLQGAVNFRDLGGFQTLDGRYLKWGRVFRSDGLSRLKDSDLSVFKAIGIRQVFDFRSPAEVAAAPNRLPETPPVAYLNLPVSRGEFDFMKAMECIKKGDTSWLTPDFMVSGYISNLETHGETWGRVIRHIAAGNDGAALFHCTGGKDRTGICAALILLALGVPEETVVADHQLSNRYIAELLPWINERIAAFGVDPQILHPYLTAPVSAIEAALEHLRVEYGSAARYLRAKAGVDDAGLAGLRQNMLDPQCP